MKTYSLDEVTDNIIGKKGTPEREKFEYELQIVGVQKAQISRLENNASNVTIDTLLKVFTALKAKVKFHIELPNAKFNLNS
jgi:transcriptional regulator with XRE-family HTH domain